MNTKTTKFTEDTLMVRPFDIPALNEYVKANYPTEPNIWFEAHKEAWIDSSPVTTNDECCYVILTKQLIDKDIHHVINIDFNKFEKTDKGTSFGMTPAFSIRFTLDELQPYLLPAISIKEFMGSRYDYNSRIASNMNNLIQLFGSK